jgi:hypothetical protein
VIEPNIKDLFEEAGGVSWISKRIKRSYQVVFLWAKRNKVPADAAIEIETRTNAILTRYQLRPDLFGEAPKKK